MALAPGSRIGGYEVVSALGAGGMGEVYRARDPRLGRDVAIKTIHADLARDPERLARFEREARAVAALSHPNIVTLFSLEEDSGTRFLVMELVEGRGLDAVIGASGLPVAKALDHAIALCDALAAAHARGIVHRDLKPGNLMLTRDERLKVLDFGLARMDESGGDPNATQAATMAAPLSAIGQVMGTAQYMAPEQVRGEHTDARTDLFAAGIILYELLTGVRPFTGATSADITSSILRDDPAPMRSRRADVPGEIDAIVARCLAKARAQRFESAQELRQALVRARQSLGRPEANPATKPEREAPSIAVLPFVNRSADAEDAYFSDGLADELLGMLAKIRGLRVAARTSSMAFKDKAVAVSEIGAALRVASVLEGTVRKSGNRVRISVQLVKVEDGYHLWSETFDRTLDDIFAVQDDIAQAVVKELRTTLLGETADTNASGDARAEVAHAAKGRAVDPESHRLFLQARYFALQNSEQGYERALALYRESLARDPGSPRCWSGLAYALWYRAAYGYAHYAESSREAREALDRAFALDPDEPEAHATLGDLLFSSDWDWQASRRAFDRALETDPNNITALTGLAVLQTCLGEFDSARVNAERLLDVDPLNSGAHVMMGRIHRNSGRFEEAVAEFRRATEISPDFVVVRSAMSLCLLELGRLDEALAMARQERAAWSRLTAESPILYALGRIEESDAAIAELIAMGDRTSTQIACCYGWRGEADKAVDWLDRAIAARDPGCAFAKKDRAFVRIHDHPRWKDFLRRMNLLD